MARKLGDCCVVVTGASSGIGRATALALAAEGAAVVLAARRAGALERLERECEERGGLALAVPTDVTDEAAVHALARRAVETFGRIDAWVNDAGVGCVGEVERVPLDVWRRILETNVLGVVNGCRAALPYMREQGHGVIVNVGSVLAVRGAAGEAPYAASQFAVRGFTESLRAELAGTGIDVTLVLPGATDTPFFAHAANYSRHAIRPAQPVVDAALVARAIAKAIRRPRRESFVPRRGRRGAIAVRLQDRSAEETAGNLFEPLERGTGESAGWRLREKRRSLLPLLAAILLPGAALLALSSARGRARIAA